MNNINNTRTSVFLDALNKDRKEIRTIDPIVVFRNILGLGDKLDTNTVFSGLQRAASSVGKQVEFQKNIIRQSFVGEVITFDIGKDTWCKFKIVREPLPNDTEKIAINFIVTVYDPVAGKRWDRLVGAIQLEDQKNGERPIPVFRTISNVINEMDIEKVAPATENLQPVSKRTQPKNPQPAVKPEEPAPAPKKEETPPKSKEEEMIIFHQGDVVEFIPDDADENVAVLETKNQSFSMVSSEFPVMRDTKSKTYKADKDITLEMLKSGFESVFGYLSLIKVTEWPKEDDLKKEVIIHANETFRCVVAGEELQFWNNSTDVCVTYITDPNISERTDWETKLFVAKEDLTVGFFKDNTLDTIFESFTEADNPEYDVVIHKDEIVNLEGHEGEFRANKDITAHELKTVEDKLTLFTIVQKETPKKEEKEMNAEDNEVLYAKGQEFEIASVPGKKFRALVDITIGMTRERNGVLDGLAEEIVSEKIADIDEPKAVGDIPTCTSCKDEHTQNEYMSMLFGTPAPTILHLFNVLKAENANNAAIAMTNTWPTETLSVYSNYTFSIVRMKNGAFYRVFVSHTDMARVQDGTASYLVSGQEKGRWFCIGNIQDREIGAIMNRRHA